MNRPININGRGCQVYNGPVYGGGGGGDRRKKRGGNRQCYNCHKTGHIARDCAKPRKGDEGRSSPSKRSDGVRGWEFYREKYRVRSRSRSRSPISTQKSEEEARERQPALQNPPRVIDEARERPAVRSRSL